MDLFEALNQRRSVRQFKSDPVSDEKLNRVLEAAQAAPSWKNLQCWKYVVVRDSAQKKALADAMPASNPSKKAIGEMAPAVVVLCADPKRSGDLGGKDYYMLDAGLSMMQLMLAAHAEGLGTCWIGWFEEEAVRAVLDVPQDFRIVAFCPLGVPQETPSAPPRQKLTEMVFSEKWGQEFKR